MDTVFIKQLEVVTIVGVYDWEKSLQQKLYFDLEMAFDNRPAAEADDINLALDYSKIAERVCAFVEKQRSDLLETLAESVAQLLMTEFGITWVKIRLHKPGALPNVSSLGVQIERGIR